MSGGNEGTNGLSTSYVRNRTKCLGSHMGKGFVGKSRYVLGKDKRFVLYCQIRGPGNMSKRSDKSYGRSKETGLGDSV